jgi:hypothetical protein
MGTQLVREIEALNLARDDRMHTLSAAARLVLFGMAASALDKPTDSNDARCYFRGWEYLAVNYLGHQSNSLTGKRAVARAVRELTEHKLITAEERINGQHSARIYRLHLLTNE